MSPDKAPSGKWWRRGFRTRYHTYYFPTSNLPGVLLFSLIALLGAAATGVAAVHIFDDGAVQHDDGVLGAIGLFCLLLGFIQASKLARE